MSFGVTDEKEGEDRAKKLFEEIVTGCNPTD